MGHKQKVNPKVDVMPAKGSKRLNDFETLEMAKEQEKQKRLKTVRIDRSTIILAEVGVSPAEAVEAFRRKINEFNG